MVVLDQTKSVVDSLHKQIKRIAKKQGGDADQWIAIYDAYLGQLMHGIEILVEEQLLSKSVLHELQKMVMQKTVRQEVKGGKLPQEILHLTENDLVKIYEAASDHYKREHYAAATGLFLCLTFFNPFVASFWLGQGMTQEKSTHYEAAAISYLMAHDVKPDDWQPVIFASECLLKQKQFAQAKELLAAVIENCTDQKIKNQAQKLMR